MMVGLVPFAVNQSYATNIKETGQTLVPMIASFVAVGSNAVLDYLFIFGIGPFPKLGVLGAALATVIARYIEAFIIIIWAHSHKEKNRYLEGAYTGFGMQKGIEGNYYQRLPTYVQRGFMGSRYDNRYPVLFHSRIGSCGRS